MVNTLGNLNHEDNLDTQQDSTQSNVIDAVAGDANRVLQGKERLIENYCNIEGKVMKYDHAYLTDNWTPPKGENWECLGRGTTEKMVITKENGKQSESYVKGDLWYFWKRVS